MNNDSNKDIPRVRLDEVVHPGKPMDNARIWLNATATDDGKYVILYHRKSFYERQGTHWSQIGNDAVEAAISHAFEHAFYLRPDRPASRARVEFHPTGAKLGQIMWALRMLTYVPDDFVTGVTS
jgi:hypothetical protein